MKKRNLIVFIFLMFLLVGCGPNYQKEFNKALEIAVRDNDVKEKQWENLVEKMNTAVSHGVRLTQKVSNEEELKIFIWNNYPEINGSATGLIRKVAKLDTVNIYLENSVSMTGYFPKGGNLNFSAPIIGLFNAGGENALVKTFLVGEQVKEMDPRQFRSELSDGKIASGKESPLAAIFAQIIKEINNNEVSFLITDAIMSGSNQDIGNNREYNYVHRAELRQGIREVFQQARKKELSVLIYRFESPFKGTYYDYKNARKILDAPNRPYFIFVFGNKEQLSIVMDNVKKEPDFKPVNMMYIGRNYETVEAYKIKSGKASEYIANNTTNTIQYKSAATHDAEVGIRIDFGNLPPYMQDVQFVKNNLRLTTIDPSTKREIDCSGFLDNVEMLNENTKELVISLLIDKSFLQNIPQVILVKMDSKPDTWYKTYSLDKDDNMTVDDNNTFALDYLIDGVLLGMDATKLPDILDIKINITKN